MGKLNGVGARLEYIRGLSKMTQRETAEGVGMNIRTYQTYEFETREISAWAVALFAKFYGWNPIWLLLGEGGAFCFNAEVVAPNLLLKIEDRLGELGKSLGAAKKSKLLSLLIKEAEMDARGIVPDERIAELIDLMV